MRPAALYSHLHGISFNHIMLLPSEKCWKPSSLDHLCSNSSTGLSWPRSQTNPSIESNLPLPTPDYFLLPYWPLHTDALNSSAIGHSKREDSNLKSASSVRTRAELQNGWLAFLQIADACMLPRRVAPIFLLSAFRKTLPTDSPLGLLIHSRVVWSTHDATVAKWRSLSGPPPSFEPCRT